MDEQFFRQIPERDAIALKEAARALVEKVGGVRAAAALLRRSASRISEAIDVHHMDRWLNLEQVAELECKAEAPIVTRALASLHHLQVERAPTPLVAPWNERLAHIIATCSKVESDLAVSNSDNVIDLKEARAMSAPVDEAIAALDSLRQALDKVKRGAA